MNLVLTNADAVAIAAFFVTLLGCTWHLSAKIEKIKNKSDENASDIKDHIKEDKEGFRAVNLRLDEVFAQLGFLARRTLPPTLPPPM